MFSLQGEAKLKPDNIEPIARAANVTPVRGAAIQHERVKHLTRVYLFCLVTLYCMLWRHSTNNMLHAVGPFDALAQVRAKREQEYQVSAASSSVCFSCMRVAERCCRRPKQQKLPARNSSKVVALYASPTLEPTRTTSSLYRP